MSVEYILTDNSNTITNANAPFCLFSSCSGRSDENSRKKFAIEFTFFERVTAEGMRQVRTDNYIALLIKKSAGTLDCQDKSDGKANGNTDCLLCFIISFVI